MVLVVAIGEMVATPQQALKTVAGLLKLTVIIFWWNLELDLAVLQLGFSIEGLRIERRGRIVEWK